MVGWVNYLQGFTVYYNNQDESMVDHSRCRSRDLQNQGQNYFLSLNQSSLLLNEVRHGVPMVQLRQKRYEMLGKPYSTCNHTTESQQSCLYRCKLKKIKLKCGCVPFFSQSEDSKHCSIMEQVLVFKFFEFWVFLSNFWKFQQSTIACTQLCSCSKMTSAVAPKRARG